MAMRALTCDVAQCGQPAKKRGWCSKHYQRWWKHGDPLASGKTPPGEQIATLLEWLRSRRRDECWIWPYSLRKGYGVLHHPDTGKMVKAHRFAVELDRGPLKHLGCHTCDTPACSNPDHVFDGTQLDNMRDAKAKGRVSPPPNRWAS